MRIVHSMLSTNDFQKISSVISPPQWVSKESYEKKGMCRKDLKPKELSMNMKSLPYVNIAVTCVLKAADSGTCFFLNTLGRTVVYLEDVLIKCLLLKYPLSSH